MTNSGSERTADKPQRKTKPKEVGPVKVTMLTQMCGPDGNASPGDPVEVNKTTADELLANKFARPYVSETDGFQKKRRNGNLVARQPGPYKAVLSE